ncbi:MAG: AbrB/MazE/SpoVT family DNA-binding domain-containing protein [Caldilineaceae bacterium]
MLQTQVQKWGNSYVRIPKPFATEIGLEQNSTVTVSIVDGKLVLEPVKPDYTLTELLSQVTPEKFAPRSGKTARPWAMRCGNRWHTFRTVVMSFGCNLIRKQVMNRQDIARR